jgi:hypothetical protein
LTPKKDNIKQQENLKKLEVKVHVGGDHNPNLFPALVPPQQTDFCPFSHSFFTSILLFLKSITIEVGWW